MSINWGSIMAKAQAHMNTPRRRKEMEQKVDEIMLGYVGDAPAGWHNAEEAGFKFADVLYREIGSAGLPPRVMDALQNAIDVSPAFKLGPGKYRVGVYFGGDLDRESMSTKKAYYDINLVRLYNDGVDHVMRQIFETDEQGNVMKSSTVIPGTGFMEQAVVDFGGNYGSEYHVIEININN